MVVTLNIADYDVHRMLVDNGSLVDILFYNAFSRVGIPPERLEVAASISGFSGEPVPIEGVIMLPLIAGWAPCGLKCD